MGESLIGGMASLLLAVFLGPNFIALLRREGVGQYIREEGPSGHVTKAGTPTMGGVLILLAISVPFLILSEFSLSGLTVFGTMLAMGALGFVDDWIKVVRRRSLGVPGKVKLAVQLCIAVALWYVSVHVVGLDETLRVRILDAEVNIGWAYIPLIFFVLAGATNGVNLTDGLDGLAAGCCAVVGLAYTGIAFISGQHDLALLAACMVGAAVGFLWFNSFPASVFMGDTGALAFGGAIAGLAVFTKTEILLIIMGGIFVIESLSVLIQVVSFRMFRRRVFLMAPIHHHFELMAWSETKIIVRFWVGAGVLSAIGFTLFQQSVGRG